MSVYERTVDGLQLVHEPGQTEIRTTVPAVTTGADGPTAVPDSQRLMRRYQRYAVTGDLALAGVAAGVATVLRFGSWQQPSYVALSVAVPMIWCALLAAKQGYEQRFLGRGHDEYRRIWEGALLLFISMAVLSYSIKAEVARGYLFVVVPLTLTLTLVHRASLHRWINRLRRRGVGLKNVLVVGPPAEARLLADRLRDDDVRGLRPTAVCSPPEGSGTDGVLQMVDGLQTDVVAVVADAGLSGTALRALSWELEERQVDLLVDPGLDDVAGDRLSIHGAGRLSLLHVRRARVASDRMLTKAVFDRMLAGTLLLLGSPILVAIAAAIKVGSPGPVLFKQTRVGADGREFTMFKFRSMITDAERLLGDLVALSDGNGVLFKLKRDPRVTRIGGFLRRYSLDELPQLINVLRGEMSLVGPRPPLPQEVAGYDGFAHRRLRLRPGLTGLWQVSGRSDLSWEESLRLDLRYVDNWSMTLDLQILLRTFRAVLHGAGAY